METVILVLGIKTLKDLKSCCTYNESRWNADNESNDGNISIDISTVHVSLQKPIHSLEREFLRYRGK